MSEKQSTQIADVCQQWLLGSLPAWPESLDTVELPKSLASSVNSARRVLAEQLGTSGFVTKYAGFDVAAYMEYQRRECPESVWTGHDVQVLAVEQKGETSNGDMVVWVRVWEGWHAARVDPVSGAVLETRKIDQTPTHEVVVRLTEGTCRIVEITEDIVESSDADPSAYGPATKHYVSEPRSL